jgi:hypothetical protein
VYWLLGKSWSLVEVEVSEEHDRFFSVEFLAWWCIIDVNAGRVSDL